jgi:hypothetical protein
VQDIFGIEIPVEPPGEDDDGGGLWR